MDIAFDESVTHRIGTEAAEILYAAGGGGV